MSSKIEDHAFPSWCGVCDPEPVTDEIEAVQPTVILEARRPGGRHRPENINPPELEPAPMTWQVKARLLVEVAWWLGGIAIFAIIGAALVVGVVWGWA